MADYPYNTTRWRKLRLYKLAKDPLCWYCEQMGKVTPADTVDHIKAHKGDPKLAWCYSNLRSSCKACHDRSGQLKDIHGYVPGVGIDGMPIDPEHPWRKGDD